MAAHLPRSAEAVRLAVAAFRGQPRMAKVLGIRQSTISEWATGRRPVPAERCLQIERETRAIGQPVTCEQLRPDCEWSVLRGVAA